MHLKFTGLPTDIPAIAEMMERPQWVAWREEMRYGKPTKPPVSPHGGYANHSDPATWGCYDQALDRVAMGNMDGVGYVLSDDDSYTGIDLDECLDEDGRPAPWAAKIVELAETYCEISPSGTGLRLIARGKLEKAVKCDPAHVEIYGKSRYLTITGNHFAGTPVNINPAPETIRELLARVGSFRPPTRACPPDAARQAMDSPANATAQPGNEFFQNVNQHALQNLDQWVPVVLPGARYYAGPRSWRISSQSLGRDLEEDLSISPTGIVDFGVHDMGDPRNGKRTAIDIVMRYGEHADACAAAFWLCERIGAAPESLGWEYTQTGGGQDVLANAEAARRLIEHHDGTLHDAETGEIVDMGPVVTAAHDEVPELPRPPGLVGAIADWIVSTSRKEQPNLAIGAALAITGTLCGRHVRGPTGAGTALYVLALAPTGRGKDAPLRACTRVLKEADLARCMGPEQWMSMSALTGMVKRQPLTLCAQDEFGAFMARIFSRRASGHERGIPKVLRELWGVNFGLWTTAEWASSASEVIEAPHLSLYGTSTHEQFYSAMEGTAIQDGTLNRFLVIEGTRKPRRRDDPGNADQVSPDILEGCRDVWHRSGALAAAQRSQADYNLATAGACTVLAWAADGAKERFIAFQDEMEGEADSDSRRADLVMRSPEMAVRIATIVAAGRRAGTVTLDDLEFGITLVRASVEHMSRGIEEFMAENEYEASSRKVMSAIAKAGRLSRRDLSRRFRAIKSREMNDILSNLIQAELIEAMEVTTASKPRTEYRALGQASHA